MKNERKKPRVLPEPPHKTDLVEPVIAYGNMHFPGQDRIVTDPDGSYTGRPLDGDKPVQDADDL